MISRQFPHTPTHTKQRFHIFIMQDFHSEKVGCHVLKFCLSLRDMLICVCGESEGLCNPTSILQ